MTVDSKPLWKTRRRGKARLRWKGEILRSNKGSDQDPLSWAIANRLRQILS